MPNEAQARIHELEEALRTAWLYDSYMCNVCGAADYSGKDGITHEDDCVVPSLLAPPSQEKPDA